MKTIMRISMAFVLLAVIESHAIVIRHDVSDQEYIDFGAKYSASVAYVGGCAATVLSDYWLLTAAHCIAGREHHFFAAQHLNKDYRVERMVLHPQFDKQLDELFDVALIQLKDPLINAVPAKLYVDSDEAGKKVIFVGRGAFGNGKQGLLRSDFIQRGATNKITSVSDQFIGFVFNKPEAATELEGISSRGDSGGPAFIERGANLLVVGVSSYQERNGLQEGTYGVYEYYSRVSLYVDWLNEVMKKEKKPQLLQHPIIDAVKNDNLKQLKSELSKATALDGKAEIINEALYQSVLLDRVTLVEELLKSGVNIKNITIDNLSVFDFALIKGRNNYFDTLLKNSESKRNLHKSTSAVLPLAIATFSDDPKLMQRVKLLIDQGADINAITVDGDTALITAGWNTNNLNLIKLLVKQGANVNLANNDGNTALMDAASLGKVDLLQYLLSKGANPALKNKHGKTALDMARGKNNQVVVDLLERY